MMAVLVALTAFAGSEDCTDVLLERVGLICPFVRDIPALYSGELPDDWAAETLSVPGDGLEEWEVPLFLLLRADGWLVSEWIDPYAGMIEMEAVLEADEPAVCDSLFASAAGSLFALAWTSWEPIRGRVAPVGCWLSEPLLFVRILPDSTQRLSGCDFWVFRPSPGRIEIGIRISCFFGEEPESAPAIPDTDHLGMLDRSDLREAALLKLERRLEETGALGQYGAGDLSWSASIPEGAELDQVACGVEITAREVHSGSGDPLTAPVAGFFIVFPVTGEVLMMDRLTGEYEPL